MKDPEVRREIDDETLDHTWRAALEAGRSDRPSDEARERMRSALLGVAVTVPATSAPTTATAKHAAHGVVAKVVLGVVVAGALAGTAYVMSRSDVRSTVDDNASSPRRESAPAVIGEGSRVTPLQGPSEQPDDRAQVFVPAHEEARPRARAPSELELIRRAHASLRTSPADALRETEEHARRFPHGAFAQEREAVAIEALVAAHRTDDARARAERFLIDYPRSSHAPRVRRLVGLSSEDPEGASTNQDEPRQTP